MRRIDTLVLDKTGTLTLGAPRLTAIHTDGVSESDALRLAAGLEQSVRHPLAEAILEAAQARGIEPAAVAQAQVVAGGGVIAHGEERLILGSPRFLQEQGVEVDKAWRAPVLLALGERVVAAFEFADEPLPEVEATLHALRTAGLRLVLCSGDRPEAVEAFAQRVGVDEWYAAQLPQQKAELVRRLRGGQAGRLRGGRD